MQQLIYFFRKYKHFLYFLFLEIIAVALIINNHSFHKSKFISSANTISGGLLHKISNINEYMNLKNENNLLLEENTLLKNKLENLYSLVDTVKINTIVDSLEFNQKYYYINGKITSNDYHTPYNFITINRGKSNNITTEMAVINSKGIIGITENVNSKYARVQSILNKNSKINVRFKNSHHFGTLIWDAKDYNTVQLIDIPRQAVYKIGDTIITGGKSTIFPEGIPVGTIKNVPEKISALNTLNIKLFNDMSNLGSIYIITNFHKTEIKKVEN
ncbi:rod shape-determining protein MreC [Tenacibaculum sp. MAR_2010_89]|uniref:rod shape-determining protein MreC n=1 Tax=Tenacibaculum sp. MAR_2010_89 TaxID=1250198 RepID=UPI000898AF71|nr:rod shape-determining protein MreC [Tenacibaculum sp. MAR_2010_89]SED42023.1 rod shape-determining protein MreC [Tenacibaculum sp. MAR_2010_89]